MLLVCNFSNFNYYNYLGFNMNYGATLRIKIEKLDGHGVVLKCDTVSLFKQPFMSRKRWFVRRGGRKSTKINDLTITEFLIMLSKWIRAWLS